ncbi:MAG TPA: hypothetical protein VI408_09545 [Gaiellaceae bacterium]
MSAHSHPLPTAIPRLGRDVVWFGVACVYAFAVPYLGISVLGLQHDVYYLVYFAAVIGLLGAYVHVEDVDLRAVLLPRWRWSAGLGLLMAAVLVFNVLKTEHGTPHPHGLYFAFEIAWRGVGYGLVDVLLLTIFPSIVAYRLVHGRVTGVVGKLRFTAAAVPLVVVLTATYHLGYPQYRQDGLARPETGNVLISVPAFATANPVGSIVAHVSQHVAAVTHAYESKIFNPPKTTS